MSPKPRTRILPLAGLIATLVAPVAFGTDRYWDPLNNNSYLSTGYTTYAAATMIWNSTGGATGIGFDTAPGNTANTQWQPGDDAFINITPGGTALAAPGAAWFMRIGTSAPTVHNVTYDSTTDGAILTFLANSISSVAANMAITGGTNGASTWTVGEGDILRLNNTASIGGATNVGVVNLVNAAGQTSVDLVKEGLGRLHIQSTGSTFTGNVRINAGSLQLGGNGSLGAAANSVYIADGAMLAVTTNLTVANTRTIFLGSAAGSGTGLLDVGSTFTMTVDSLIADNGVGADNLNKTNGGTVLLTNANNSYTGATILSGGTLQVSSLANAGGPSVIGSSSSAAANLVFNAGTLNFNSTAPASTDRLFTIGGTMNISNNSAATTNSIVWTNPGAVVNTATAAHSITLGGTNQGANTFAPALTDNGANVLSLVKGGASNWTVTGTHTYTGTTTVGNGTAGGSLEFNGALTGAGGLVNVTTGNTLRGTGLLERSASIVGTLAPGSAAAPYGTLALGGTLTFDPGAAFAIKLGGTSASKVTGVTDLTLNGNVVGVTLDAANLPSGTVYDIIDYSGVLSGAFDSNVAIGGLVGLISRINFGIDYGTANKVQLTQTGTAKSIVWTGADGVTPADWDVDNVVNWVAGGAEKFFDLDTVTFNDSAASRIVQTMVNVTPSAITVNNTGANDYDFSNLGGVITGPTTFAKTGSGRLTISGANSFTGAFSLNGGTVATATLGNAGAASPLGQGTLAFGGGTLEYTGVTATSSKVITLSAGGGTISIPTGVELTLSSNITGVGGLTKADAGTLTLSGNSAYDGAVLVSAGTLKLSSNGALGSTVGGTTIQSGATLDANGNRVLPQDEIITASGVGVGGLGAIINSSATQGQNFIRKLVLTGDTTIGGAGRWDVRMAGSVTAGFVAGTDAFLHGNGYSLTKVGPNDIGILGVGDTDLGNININEGKIIFHDDNDLAGMLASDITLGRLDDGLGNPYKLTLQPGTTAHFFNTDNTKSKEIVVNGVGTAATIQMNSTAGLAPHMLTLDKKVTVDGGLTLLSSQAGITTLNISGGIADGSTAAVLSKTGAGLARLSGNNTYTGGTSLTAGVLQAGHNNALGVGALTITGGTLSSADTTARTLANATTITANATLGDATNNGLLTFSPVFNLGAAVTLTTASNVLLSAGFSDGGSALALTKAGAGVLSISAASTATGIFTITGGRVAIGHDTGFGTGSLILNGGAISSIGSTPRTITNPVSVTTASTFGDTTDDGTLTIQNTVNLTGAARTLTANSDVILAGGFTNGGLGQKSGPAKLTLQGTSSQAAVILQLWSGTFVLDGSLTVGEAVRVMANTTPGTTSQFDLTTGSTLNITLGSANLRIGHESSTISNGINIANISGMVNLVSGSTGGFVQMGSNSALAQLNLKTGGLITTKGVNLAGAGSANLANTELNLDGGTLRAFQANTTFISGLTNTFVKAGGGTIDSNGFNLTIPQALLHDPALGVTPDGGITKVGAGTLTLTGTQGYSVLNADGGTTSLQAPLGTGSSILNVDAHANTNVSQTLAALNIGDGAVFTLNAAGPAPGEEPQFGESFDAVQTVVVPEPGSTVLLLGGLAAMLGLRRRPRTW